MNRPAIADVVAGAAKIWNVTERQIISPRRTADFIEPRKAVYYVANDLGHPKSKIGLYIGDRDHTTIISGIRSIRNLMAQNSNLKARVQNLKVIAINQAALPLRIGAPCIAGGTQCHVVDMQWPKDSQDPQVTVGFWHQGKHLTAKFPASQVKLTNCPNDGNMMEKTT